MGPRVSLERLLHLQRLLAFAPQPPCATVATRRYEIRALGEMARRSSVAPGVVPGKMVDARFVNATF